MSTGHELGPLPEPEVHDAAGYRRAFTQHQIRSYALAEIRKALSQQAQEIERLRAQRVPLTEDQIDAKRYRWLRDGIKFDWPVTRFPTPPWCVRLEVDHGLPVSKLIEGAALDVAIDAAIEAAHGIHPLQRLADLSKEIGEKL